MSRKSYIRGIIFGLIGLIVNLAEGGIQYNPIQRQFYPYRLNYRQPFNVDIREGINQLNTRPQTSGVTPVNGALLRPEIDLSLLGRELDLSITRWYNSKIWQQWSHYRNYYWSLGEELYRPFLVPYTPMGIGWSLHMGKMYYDDSTQSFIYEASGGSVYGLRHKVDSIYTSTDISSFQYDSLNKVLIAKDGTKYFFDTLYNCPGETRVKKIQGSNGNYIQIIYKELESSPGDRIAIDSIIDDCNRIVKFHYSYFLDCLPCLTGWPAYKVLDSITYKGFDGENLAIKYHYKADTIINNPLDGLDAFWF